MVVNDDTGSLTPSGVFRFIASMLAPTGETTPMKKPPTAKAVGGFCLSRTSDQTLTIQPAGASMSPVCTPVSSL
ncbi:hypothetical protein CES87_24640 [Pseudomonas sp. ERMR1:02]|nr:hypothetical protein CES87_24640 [Pseudomonas sp. ERMR1:02]